MRENTLPEEKHPDFLLTFYFEAGLKNPQRIFSTASDCIDALQAYDEMLLKTFPSTIKPVFVLEQVDTGSIRIWLKQFLEAVDDDAIKNLDWKPAVGKYLIKGKYLLLKMLECKTGLPDKKDMEDISNELHNLAKETDVLRFPAYSRVRTNDIAKHVKQLSDATQRLEKGEYFSMESDEGKASIQAGLSVTDADIDAMLVERSIRNISELILMVRRPDFLGEAKWEFRLNRRNMSVTISDRDWLAAFQAGEKDIRPGDALHVKMSEIIDYDANGEVISEHREIVNVFGIIRGKVQGSLFDDGKN